MLFKVIVALLLVVLFAGIAYYFLRRQEGFEDMPAMSYYFLPNCGWCKKFAPTWEAFEERVKAEQLPVKTRKIDGSQAENSKEIEEKGVTGFPHVELQKGAQSVPFEGERSVDVLVEFVKKNL